MYSLNALLLVVEVYKIVLKLLPRVDMGDDVFNGGDGVFKQSVVID